MSFATNMQTVASNLLTSYGRSITLSRVTEGAYDTATSSLTPGSTTSYSGYGHPSPYTTEEVDGSTVLIDDIKLLLYTSSTPLVGDTATLDSIVHRVISVQKLSAQGINIVYKLQLRS